MNDALTMLILDRDVLVPRVRAGDVLIFHQAEASTLLPAIDALHHDY